MAVASDERMPCSKKAITKLTEASRSCCTPHAAADDMVAFFRTVHDFDIQRIREPRGPTR